MAKRSKKKNRPQEATRAAQTPARTKNFPTVANGKLFALQIAALVGAVVWIFWPAMQGGWVWDDVFDIPQNPVTRNPAGIWKIWFEPGSQVDYYPIKASVQWLQ